MTDYDQSLISLQDIKRLAVAYQRKLESKSSMISSIDYHYNGEVVVFNSENQALVLYMSNEKVSDSIYNLNKHGVGLSRFVDDRHIVHSSVKDDKLRLLSIEKKSYIRYFPGHSKEVNSLSVQDMSIATGSKDSTVLLWDVRTQKSVHRFEFSSPPLVAFHPFGKFIAIAYSSSTVKVFDWSNLGESIHNYSFERIDGVEWTGLKFSDDGMSLMITTNSTSILIINVTTGHELHNFRDYSNVRNENIDACFTAGSDFVISGSSEGSLHVWDCNTSLKIRSFSSCFVREGSCRNVAFNPKFMNLASSNGNVLQLWNENVH